MQNGDNIHHDFFMCILTIFYFIILILLCVFLSCQYSRIFILPKVKYDNSNLIKNARIKNYNNNKLRNEYFKSSDRFRRLNIKIQINLYSSIALEKTFKHRKR
jgi:hypothetical protein